MVKLMWFCFSVVAVLADRYYDLDYHRFSNGQRRFIDVYSDAIQKSYSNYKDQKYIYPKAQVLPIRPMHFDQEDGDEIKFNSDVLTNRQPHKLTHPNLSYQRSRPKFKTTKNQTEEKIPRGDDFNQIDKTLSTKVNDILRLYFYKLYKRLGGVSTSKEEFLEDTNGDFYDDIETLSDSTEKGLSQNFLNAFDDAKLSFNNTKSKFLDPNKLWMIKNSTQFLAKKFLSLFTIIKFPNAMCTGSNGVNVYDGTCYYESECQARNGTAMGICADGYGVCCVFIRSCGATSGQNCSYFESPNYPNYYPSNGTIIPPTISPLPNATIDPRLRYQLMMFLARQESASNSLLCEFQVTKLSNAVRQLRVDFLDLELRGPTNGTCVLERLVVTGQNRNNIIPAICGYNSGQHIYVDVTDVIGPIRFSVIATVVERKRFRLKICQITECNPLNCLQYFTGTSGVVSSFNYDQTSSLSRSIPGYFNNLNYAVCIRKEAGYCSVTYSNVINGTTYQFQLVNFDDAGMTTVPPGQAGAEIFSCPDDFIVINGIRLCGERLNDGSATIDFTRNAPVTDTGSGPIIVPVRTDAAFIGRGFRLFYTQNLCS